MRGAIRVISIISSAAVLGGCVPNFWRVSETTSNVADYNLWHHWGPARVIENGVANSCYETDSEVEGRAHVCRVIDGHEGTGDRRDFMIAFESGGALKDSPWYRGVGMSTVLPDGSVYEGCTFVSWPYYGYACDYRSRKHVILRTNTSSWDYVLRKLWNWGGYIGSAAGCAGGITGLWAGTQKVTLPLLSDCVDGPL